METRRDRAFHLPFCAPLCRHARVGRGGVSLSRDRKGTGARATGGRRQVAYLYFRATRGMATISSLRPIGAVERRGFFTWEVFSPTRPPVPNSHPTFLSPTRAVSPPSPLSRLRSPL